MYQLKKIVMYGTESFVILRNNADGTITSFGEYPDNTDFANFKKDLQDGVELQDAEGQVMTKEQVEEFMRSLP